MTTDPVPATDLWRRLEQVIAERIRLRPGGSYVVELLDGGHPAMSGKVIEEAYELIEACGGEDQQAAVHEAADLLFHVLVLLGANDIRLVDVERELAQRFGVSGLAEKAARRQGPA